jgi:hypothetical protein
MPLDESEYTCFEVHELSSGDGFTDGSNDDDIVYESTSGNETTIKVFSFNTSSEDKGHSTDTFIESAHNNISLDGKFSKPKETSSIEPQNLSASPMQKIRSLTPKIDGEAFDVKRCYQFRSSTIKKLNQLKGESDNINIYLNEIIDAAICFYHDSVFNKK